MRTTGQTAAEIDAANRYQSYMRGWRDGACAAAHRDEFKQLAAGAPLRVAYFAGYDAGLGARAAAQATASKAYGYEPDILRTIE